MSAPIPTWSNGVEPSQQYMIVKLKLVAVEVAAGSG
jgi:hypothetical protein